MTNLLLKARDGRANALAKRNDAQNCKFARSASDIQHKKPRRYAALRFESKRAQGQIASWAH